MRHSEARRRQIQRNEARENEGALTELITQETDEFKLPEPV